MAESAWVKQDGNGTTPKLGRLIKNKWEKLVGSGTTLIMMPQWQATNGKVATT